MWWGRSEWKKVGRRCSNKGKKVVKEEVLNTEGMKKGDKVRGVRELE